jgi:ADP-ribose pyrophosphatase YjhB (NUDIX family)
VPLGAVGVSIAWWRGILTSAVPSYYRDPEAPSPNVPRRVGVVAVIERDGAFLVERRVDDAHQWAFVGGTVEEDERILDGLHREVREETGLEIERASLLGLFSDPTRIVEYPDGTVCRILSVAFHVVPRGTAEPVASSESAGMEFVSRVELADRPFWPAHTPVLETVLARPSEIVVA